METQEKTKMYERIEKHGEQLNKIFNTSIEPVALCKKLRRLENKAHNLTTMECNGEIEETESIKIRAEIRKALIKVLNLSPEYPLCGDDSYPIFINGDARGYALKISDEWIRNSNIDIYKDWGGYGIIAPDLSN